MQHPRAIGISKLIDTPLCEAPSSQCPTHEMLNIDPRLLLAFLWFGLCTHLHAADGQSPARLAQPTEWIARGFVPPSGAPECLVDAPPSLDRETLSRLCGEARKGDPKAQHNLGQLFFLTKGSAERDYDEAYKWFHLAAGQGLPAAQYAMGLLHIYSLGIVGNRDEAIQWLSKAANSGHANAQYWLGLYYAATIRASEENTRESIKWLRRSAEQGNRWAAEVLSNTTKRRALDYRPATEAEGDFDFKISLAACTAGYDLNDQKSARRTDGDKVRFGEPENNPNLFRYFTQADLLRAIKESPETYTGMMEICFDGIASMSGAGFVQ